MQPDPASLDNLRDIAEMPAVPWWPLAPGWWIVLGLVLAALIVFSFKAWRSWRANAYRRAARGELAATSDLRAVCEILKRTALAAYPRTEVAALTGSAWCDWLEETGGKSMPDQVRAAMTGGVFGKSPVVNAQDVTAFAAVWIAGHPCENKTEGELGC